MSDNIPFEIQSEIMKWLPIKSLIQFRSVSKQWNSLITSSDFIAEYHNHHTQPPEHIFVSYFDQQSYERKYVSFVDDDTFPRQKFSLKVPESVSKRIDYLKLVGSSNGLLCLYNVYTAVIWNPTICKSVDVYLDIVFDSNYKTVIGFGVSPHTLDPIIVKVTLLYVDVDVENFDHINFAPWQVEVFMLSSGVWRSPLCNSLPRESIQLTSSVVDINGFLYFLAYEWIVSDEVLRRSFLIISFDMKSEEFTEIHLPNSLAYGNGGNLVLSKLQDSVAVIEFRCENEEFFRNVWMMENDVQRLVTKLFTISLQNATMIQAFGFRKSGEALINLMTSFEQHNGLFVYDPYSKNARYLGIFGKNISITASSYVESLLLLNR